MILKDYKLFLIISDLVLLLAGSLTMIVFNQPAGYLGIAIGLLIIFFFGAFRISTKSFYKKLQEKYDHPECEFKFYDYYFEELLMPSDANEVTRLDYTSIMKVYDTRNAFYIILSPKEAFVVSKHSFVAGTGSDLAALLKPNVAKYITKK
jgi:hypothetical protein